jgi:hypothetical protein
MKTIIKITVGLLILLALAGAWIWWHHDHQVIPENITQQVNFVIFYPAKTNQIVIQRPSFKYDKSIKQVSFIVRFSGQSITFAEQSSPDSFSDDANFYPQFIQKLNGYAAFDSINGTVNLTVPTETKNEAGVMNAKGTLLFAQSTTGNLNENNWKELFNSLSYVQP